MYLPEDNQYKYLLVVVDQATRQIDAIPLKNKDNNTVLNAFKKVYNHNKILTEYIDDNGTEFVNSTMNKYFEDNNINHRKSIAGRHRQTANNKLVKAIFKKQTANELVNKKWVDFLPTLIESINKRARDKKNVKNNNKLEDADM